MNVSNYEQMDYFEQDIVESIVINSNKDKVEAVQIVNTYKPVLQYIMTGHETPNEIGSLLMEAVINDCEPEQWFRNIEEHDREYKFKKD